MKVFGLPVPAQIAAYIVCGSGPSWSTADTLGFLGTVLTQLVTPDLVGRLKGSMTADAPAELAAFVDALVAASEASGKALVAMELDQIERYANGGQS